MIITCMVILEQCLLHLPLMLGAYISFSLLKVPDLSIETAYVVGAIAGTMMMTAVAPMHNAGVLILILLASALGGALVGMISSVFTQKGHVSHLLSSIITFGLFHGINQYLSPSYRSLSGYQNPLTVVQLSVYYPDLPVLLVIGCVLIVLFYALCKTQLGHAFAVYGNNPYFFDNYGISKAYVFVTGIMLANALAGLSGYLFAQSNNFVELNMGLGKALLCIAALILGKVIVRTQSPCSLLIPLFGTGIYFTIQQLLLKVGFNLKYFTALQSVVLVIILVCMYRKNALQSNDALGV